MADLPIKNDEFLNRALLPYPELWNTEKGRPTSALFKDKKGMSVDRDKNRDTADVVSYMNNKFINLKGVVRFPAGYARNLGCRVEPDSSRKNLYHSLVLGAERKILSKTQAKKLSENCEILLN